MSSSNLAAIMLAEKVRTTASVAPAVVSTETKLDAFVGERLLVCGFGVLNNQREKARSLKCTTLRVVPFIQCFKALAATAEATQIFEFSDDDEDNNDDDDDDDNDNDDDYEVDADEDE